MSWQEDYLVALRARDEREQSDKAVIDAYTKLADRSAILETSKKSAGSSRAGSSSQHGTPSSPSSSPNPGIPRPLVPPPNSKTGGGPSITTLQSDLGEAQSQRAELQEQVAVLMAERDRARTQLHAESGRSRALEAERAVLGSKLRDRDEELRGKAKLLDDVQNETVTLEMQLNVTEEKNKNLKAENKELVDRWMARMGEEADKMNLESKFT